MPTSLKDTTLAWLVIGLSGNPLLALCTMVVDTLILIFLFRGLRRSGLMLAPTPGSPEVQ